MQLKFVVAVETAELVHLWLSTMLLMLDDLQLVLVVSLLQFKMLWLQLELLLHLMQMEINIVVKIVDLVLLMLRFFDLLQLMNVMALL